MPYRTKGMLRRGPTSRAAFTLLEVTVALSLTLLLLTAVYGAIRLQYRMTTAGRDQMERTQLSRAILQMIENDVRSVVWQVQQPGASDSSSSTSAVGDTRSSGQSTSGQSSSGQSASGQSSTSQTSTGSSGTSQSSSGGSTEQTDKTPTADEAFTGGSSGIFGDTKNLVLHISRPSRSLVYSSSAEDEAKAADRSDLASVSYFIADINAGGLAGAVAQQHGDTSMSTGIVGLSRLEGDRLSIERAGETDDVESLATSAKVLAPEVVSIEFAYWDGIEWFDSWDSVSSGTLPSAIGITLSLDVESPHEDRSTLGRVKQAMTRNNGEDIGKPVQVRYVVAVPLAEPYVSEASF